MKKSNFKRKSTLVWIVTLVAILLLAVAVTAAITQGFSEWNPWGWFEEKETCEHVYVDGVCSECGEEEPDDSESSEENKEDEESEDASISSPSTMSFYMPTELSTCLGYSQFSLVI